MSSAPVVVAARALAGAEPERVIISEMMVRRWKRLCITRECAPTRVIAETAKMELEPDEVRLIDKHGIAARFITITRGLYPPLSRHLRRERA